MAAQNRRRKYPEFSDDSYNEQDQLGFGGQSDVPCKRQVLDMNLVPHAPDNNAAWPMQNRAVPMLEPKYPEIFGNVQATMLTTNECQEPCKEPIPYAYTSAFFTSHEIGHHKPDMPTFFTSQEIGHCEPDMPMDFSLPSVDCPSTFEAQDEPLEICFGMICDVGVQFCQGPPVDIGKIEGTSKVEKIFRLTLASRNDYFVIVSDTEECLRVSALDSLGPHHDRYIGFLNRKTSHQLKGLTNLNSIRYEVCITASQWVSKHEARQPSRKGKPDAVDINIYGSSDDDTFRRTGEILSTAGLFLQNPQFHTGIHVNPHIMEFSDISTCDSGDAIEGPKLSPLASRDPLSQCQSSRPHASISIASILDDLPGHDCVGEIKLSECIKTTLLSHQKQGVAFILEKETTGRGIGTLWNLEDGGGGGSYYRHVITGAKRTSLPHEPPGGILADSMGLGKSLTMIAAIVTSLDRATTFLQAENSIPLKAQGKTLSKGTLVIAPSALILDGWIDEIRKHIQVETLQFYKYHGQGRESDLSRLKCFDIIFTTYATVVAEFRHGRSLLHNMKFFRIVLDEAHVIRSPTTKQFHAICALDSKCRWCLTGTPVQNKLEDLGALVKFLQIPILNSTTTFRLHIVNPSISGSTNHFNNLRLLLGSICLRRTEKVLNMPNPIIERPLLQFSTAEREVYQSIAQDFRRMMDVDVCTNTGTKAYNGVLRALLRLRRFCNNGTFDSDSSGIYRAGSPTDPDEALALLQQTGQATCAHCHCDILSINEGPDFGSGTFTACRHLLCGNCLPEYEADLNDSQEGGRAQCPICYKQANLSYFTHSTATHGYSQESIGTPPWFSESGFSSKLHALIENIEEHRSDHKCIVFSNWRRTLQIVGYLLNRVGAEFSLIDGTVPLASRREIIKQFHDDPDSRVLLMTLGTGAVGLNLTAATRIHILEPQWNPAVERQAIRRAIRLGQTSQVTVIRYMMNKSVEEFVKDLQRTKLEMAERGFRYGEESEANQTMRELRNFLCDTER